jgi:hypothetical protein
LPHVRGKYGTTTTMSFTPAAKAEKQLRELLRLPANKRCADCSGTGSLVRAPRARRSSSEACKTGPPPFV